MMVFSLESNCSIALCYDWILDLFIKRLIQEVLIEEQMLRRVLQAPSLCNAGRHTDLPDLRATQGHCKSIFLLQSSSDQTEELKRQSCRSFSTAPQYPSHRKRLDLRGETSSCESEARQFDLSVWLKFHRLTYFTVSPSGTMRVLSGWFLNYEALIA